MKMKDLFCTLSLFLGLLALPLPGRAQNPDSLLREAAARDQQVRMRLLEMNRRVNGSSSTTLRSRSRRGTCRCCARRPAGA